MATKGRWWSAPAGRVGDRVGTAGTLSHFRVGPHPDLPTNSITDFGSNIERHDFPSPHSYRRIGVAAHPKYNIASSHHRD